MDDFKKLGRGGYGGISNIYFDGTYQRGKGIGGYLGGLFRKAVPYVKQGAKDIAKEAGKELYRKGTNKARQMIEKHFNLQDATDIREQGACPDLKRKACDTSMQVGGYKKRKTTSSNHSRTNSHARRGSVKKTKLKNSAKKKKKKTIRKKKTKKNITKKKQRTVADIFQ